MKGESERVPRKNLRFLSGKPLCWYILNNLSLVDQVSEIIINTDCDNIKDTVRSFNFSKVRFVQTKITFGT